MTVQGQVLGFDGLHLRLATEHGHLTLDYASVTCEGATCPDPERDAAVIRFAGMVRMGEVILPALTEGFARDQALIAERQEIDERTSAYVLRSSEGKAELAFVFRATPTADGYADLLADEADVLMTSQALGEDEVDLAREVGMSASSFHKHFRNITSSTPLHRSSTCAAGQGTAPEAPRTRRRSPGWSRSASSTSAHS